tara:strand:+ start:657 stop:833 length:177 start_codon:yes stop_codon:yes gene_type:complete
MSLSKEEIIGELLISGMISSEEAITLLEVDEQEETISITYKSNHDYCTNTTADLKHED